MGLISTIQNKTEQARAKERIKPLLESRMMRDILLEVGQRGTEKLDPQSVPLEQRPRAAKLAAENGTAGLLQSVISEVVLDEKGIAYDYCPGVSAFCGAASALNLEYTLPDISQSVIITRMEGRTPVPSKESIQSFAAHQATMVVFLSTGMLEELSRRLIEGGYTADTPAAIVYKATWPEQKTFVCTVGTLAKTAAENNITKTALMIIGDTVAAAHYDRSKLYDPEFTTEFREAVKSKTHHS